jgi:hypothetical protein
VLARHQQLTVTVVKSGVPVGLGTPVVLGPQPNDGGTIVKFHGPLVKLKVRSVVPQGTVCESE